MKKQCAAVNTLSRSIKVPPHLPANWPLYVKLRSAIKGYLPLGTFLPPITLGLTEAEDCLSAACGAASPLCTNTKKDTTIIAANNAPTKVAHNGPLMNL